MNKEKQKTMIVLALGVVLLGVGVFQFLPKGSPAVQVNDAAQTYAPDDAVASLTPEEKEAAERDAILATLGGPLPPRDPFRAGKPIATPAMNPAPAPASATTQRPTSSPRPSGQRYVGGGSGGSRRPGPLPGGVPPWNPGGPNGGANGVSIRPGSGFAVVGTVTGDRPAAIIRDADGRQRIVPLGGQVDPDTTVVGIDRGQVRVKTTEGERTLNLEGN